MSFQVRAHPQAEEDVDEILTWLAQRSRQGAITWYESWLEALRRLQTSAQICEVASEAEGRKRDVRQAFFKTRRGRKYRILFTLQAQTVVILHVRGPGQDLLDPDDLREP